MEKIWEKVNEYVDFFNKLRIREALKTAMDISDLSNKYIHNTAIWEKTIEKSRLDNSLFILANVIRLTALLLEPFVPTLSAKIYFILNIDRKPEHEALLGKLVESKSSGEILKLIDQGHEIRTPIPLITQSNLKSPKCG